MVCELTSKLWHSSAHASADVTVRSRTDRPASPACCAHTESVTGGSMWQDPAERQGAHVSSHLPLLAGHAPALRHPGLQHRFQVGDAPCCGSIYLGVGSISSHVRQGTCSPGRCASTILRSSIIPRHCLCDVLTWQDRTHVCTALKGFRKCMHWLLLALKQAGNRLTATTLAGAFFL